MPGCSSATNQAYGTGKVAVPWLAWWNQCLSSVVQFWSSQTALFAGARSGNAGGSNCASNGGRILPSWLGNSATATVATSANAISQTATLARKRRGPLGGGGPGRRATIRAGNRRSTNSVLTSATLR